MRLQSGKNQSRVRNVQRRIEQDHFLLDRLPGIFKAMAFFAIVAGICNAYIYLNQQRNNTARSISRLRTELIRIENETINERNRGERLRDWTNIQAQIRRYQLPLELPERGQRRQIALMTPQQAAQVHYQAAASPLPSTTAVATTAVRKISAPAATAARLLPSVSASASVYVPPAPAPKAASRKPLFGRKYRTMTRYR